MQRPRLGLRHIGWGDPCMSHQFDVQLAEPVGELCTSQDAQDDS